MMYNLITTDMFKDDLDEALDYIVNKLYNPSAATRLMDKISDIFSLLEENPFIFPIYHDSEIAKLGYRFAVVAKYLIFYRIDEIERTVYISHFLYGGQNITDKFKVV